MATEEIKVFCSYSHEDEPLREKLKKQLATLEREGLIKEWHDRQISAGSEWKREIDQHLEEAHIILLLISADFLASDYCNDVELKRSLERHREGTARVIPVILRPCDWTSQPFSRLQALPKDARAIITWDHIDEALTDVVQGLRKVINELRGTGANPVAGDSYTQNGMSSELPPISDAKRVQLMYDYETPTGKKWRELPFVIGVLAPLSGQHTDRTLPLSRRRFIKLDQHNINDVIRGIRPTLSFSVPNKLSNDGEQFQINLFFETLEDFTSDRVARQLGNQVEGLRKLLDVRNACIQLLPLLTRNLETVLQTLLANNDTILQIVEAFNDCSEKDSDSESDLSFKYSDMFQKIKIIKPGAEVCKEGNSGEISQIEVEQCDIHISDLLQSAGCNDRRTWQSIATFLWCVEKQPQLIQDSIERSLKNVIATIDDSLTRQLICILHDSAFQALEATWRGLHYLVQNIENDHRLAIKVLDVTKDELSVDLRKDRHIETKVYEEEYKTLSGEPFSVLLGDYYFSHQTKDVAKLRDIASVCWLAHVPFLASASPEMFQLDSFKQLYQRRNLSLLFENPDYQEWNRFRVTDDSYYIGLILPRVLTRLPYIGRSSSSAKFELEELAWDRAPSHEQLAWGNAVYMLGVCLGRAFAKYGWCAAVSGPNTGGAMSDLLVYPFKTKDGDQGLIGPTEVALSDRMETELSDLGFICLCKRLNTNEATFFTLPSCHRSRCKETRKLDPESLWYSRLQYWLVKCRFAQYLGVMAYEKVQAFESLQSFASYLQNWLATYVKSNIATREAAFRFPLQAATVQISESNEETFLTVSLQPRLQLYDITGIKPPSIDIKIYING